MRRMLWNAQHAFTDCRSSLHNFARGDVVRHRDNALHWGIENEVWRFHTIAMLDIQGHERYHRQQINAMTRKYTSTPDIVLQWNFPCICRAHKFASVSPLVAKIAHITFGNDAFPLESRNHLKSILFSIVLIPSTVNNTAESKLPALRPLKTRTIKFNKLIHPPWLLKNGNSMISPNTIDLNHQRSRSSSHSSSSSSSSSDLCFRFLETWKTSLNSAYRGVIYIQDTRKEMWYLSSKGCIGCTWRHQYCYKEELMRGWRGWCRLIDQSTTDDDGKKTSDLFSENEGWVVEFESVPSQKFNLGK